MQEIHSRATMLAREASSREEELVAMKVVELKEDLAPGRVPTGPKKRKEKRNGPPPIAARRVGQSRN